MKLSTLTRIGLLTCVGAALPSLFGCLDHPLKPVEYDKAQEEQETVDLAVNKDVDILFVIDNSGSMGEEQGTLAANFSKFIEVLERPKVKANYRIGVTTTDNGNPQCNGTTPEGGKLRLTSCRSRESEFTFTGTNPQTVKFDEACASVCPDTLANLDTIPTSTEDDPEPKSRAWIESIEGKTNLPDGVSTTQAFQCFGPQGINGCGFESQLESMWKSLQLMEVSGSPNFGFRRKNAILSVVIVTDEADCSLDPDYGTIFDPNGNRVFWSDPNSNFPTSAVCWNAGVKCEGGPGTYTSCDPVNKDVDGNEGVPDDQAVLFPLSKYIDLLQTIENDKQSRVPG
ncbi:MAG: VWA domain-containing protein, partial [Deltaproteobacteria bacterium]